MMQLNVFNISCYAALDYLKSITWDGSEERWKALPITQTGTCGKVTHL